STACEPARHVRAWGVAVAGFRLTAGALLLLEGAASALPRGNPSLVARRGLPVPGWMRQVPLVRGPARGSNETGSHSPRRRPRVTPRTLAAWLLASGACALPTR